MKKLVTITFLVIFILSAAAQARQHRLPSVGLKVDIPKTWKVESEGDVMTAMTPAEDLAIIFWEFAGQSDMQAALAELDRELDRFVKKPKVIGEPLVTKINGLDAVLIDGKGKVEGRKIKWSLGLVGNGRGKILMLLGFAEPKAIKKHGKKIEKILKSIKRK